MEGGQVERAERGLEQPAADMGHSWAAWFVDPSRNVLAVVQPKR
jgi:hypothetical protein